MLEIFEYTKMSYTFKHKCSLARVKVLQKTSTRGANNTVLTSTNAVHFLSREILARKNSLIALKSSSKSTNINSDQTESLLRCTRLTG